MQLLTTQWMLVGAVLLCALVPLAAAARRGQPGSRPALVLLGALSAAVLVRAALEPAPAPAAIPEDRPVATPTDGYVTSNTCRSCHPRPYATWHASYHRTMTQLVDRTNALGDFDFRRIRLRGRRYLLGHTGDQLWVEFQPEGMERTVRRPVVLATGSHHDQMYWHTTPGYGDDLQQLPVSWSIRMGRWIPVNSSFLTDPGLDLGYPPAAWNRGCSGCHAVHRRVDQSKWVAGVEDASIDTFVSEFGIACEACHGPGEEHVALNRDPRRRYGLHVDGEGDDSVVNPARLSHVRSTQVCGQCHSIHRDEAGKERHYRPGQDLDQHVLVVRHAYSDPEREVPGGPWKQGIERLAQREEHYWGGYFWSDGMIRVSGREFNGLLESPCFQRGELACTSCHTLHQQADDPRPREVWANDQLGVGMDTNAACLSCHPKLASEAELEAHTRHPARSRGSLCYDCHMPHTTYGIQKAHRSHQISVPSVAESLETGRPNACSQCHLDRTLEWTGRYLTAWYDQPEPELNEAQRELAAGVLWSLRGEAGQRALMAWSMGWAPALEASGSDWMVPYLLQLLDDPYDSVRFIAIRSLQKRPEFADWPYDFIASRAKRLAALERAAESWEAARPDGVARGSAALLHDASGRPMRDEIEHHWSQRDDTLLNLRE